jgi:creatinine amidohydrolase
VSRGEGVHLLAERLARIPGALREAFAQPALRLPFDPRTLRRIRVTGLGSSEAQARLLAALLSEYAGFDARFVPTGELAAGPPPGAAHEALVVFSQGLSPNARFALRDAARWRHSVLLTSVSEDDADPERAAILDGLREIGALLVPFPGGDERGTLVRLIGSMTGMAAALRLARAFGAAAGRPAPGLDVAPERICERVEAALASIDARLSEVPEGAFDQPIAFLASGSYAELLFNLRLKWLEGLLRPLPPVWELLGFAHGPLQQAWPQSMTFLALSRPDAPHEADLLKRAESVLDPSRHRIVQLASTLPAPLALFEHEALLDALVVRRSEALGLDPTRWPARGLDAPLYDHAPEQAPRPAGAVRKAHGNGETRLAALVWPDLEARLAGGRAIAVVPLGATEQHGPHLPFATDTWIADALAERFCAQVPHAVRLPALALGCSSEHAAFPGTLSLSPGTLSAVLRDLMTCLARHGFARAFVFSAHGGNYEALRAATPSLRQAAAPMRLCVFTDIEALTRTQQRAAAAHGIDAASAGHHAGEFETSILSGLRPELVRRGALAPGVLHPAADAQHLFHPDLRPNAPLGTVGDPRPADAARADAYLDAWTRLLVDHHRAESEG